MVCGVRCAACGVRRVASGVLRQGPGVKRLVMETSERYSLEVRQSSLILRTWLNGKGKSDNLMIFFTCTIWDLQM